MVDMVRVLISSFLLFLVRVSHRPLTLQHIGQIHLPAKVIPAYTYSINVSVLLIPFANLAQMISSSPFCCIVELILIRLTSSSLYISIPHGELVTH
jgi:hypothetical protein